MLIKLFMEITQLLLMIVTFSLRQNETATIAPTTADPCYENCNRSDIHGGSICGNNGKTYANSCLFRVDQCRYRAKRLDMKQYKGYIRCSAGLKFGPLPRYCARCIMTQYDPVCGSNNITFAYGQCGIDYYNCLNEDDKNRTIMTIQRRGFCKADEPCNENCYLYGTHYQCGSDGQTYRNLCHLQKEQCWKRKYNRIVPTVAFVGHCDKPPVDPETDCSKHVTVCPTYRREVCGSDNKTYRNTCEFFKAECSVLKEGRTLTIKYIAACRRSKIIG